MSRPIVVIPCCAKRINDYTFDAVKREYSAAVAQAADCQPLLMPIGAALIDVEAALAIADGLLFTGSPSNVHPSHYGDETPANPEALDLERDAVTLPLVRTAIERGVPMLAICRGFQELNVALGGSLFQEVHSQEGYMDHREGPSPDVEERWGPKHPLQLTGKLKEWIGEDKIMVNSLHGQGVSRLAEGLQPEAYAEDGLVEAVRGPNDDAFCVGVQWHPEWDATTNPASKELFTRFGAAARSRK
ncbi:gamma-glutamyl-gamma-aminobutyrate hydrolase family protein [Methyloligella sp. 2.7D]|uniref:gamma-glutamyl-gamma-aminobutyrate hydrolase family protein n=1 Tax=unclassified Methyloligella TaxID=2625955 RepID=UPI00157DFC50|nr:gamma-glutamyl-gamma-aminobutyrate hydrolase family protein [Methyloligella sp. GL2]QKP76009.1 gamma-glutamyl-gamma-aminobutyrate hydrolase family protein [Methyloligella sp. GL2]